MKWNTVSKIEKSKWTKRADKKIVAAHGYKVPSSFRDQQKVF